MRWFETHRMGWIAARLHTAGFINREHLQCEFEISSSQASHDLRTFERLNPGAMTYDLRAKRYVATKKKA